MRVNVLADLKACDSSWTRYWFRSKYYLPAGSFYLPAVGKNQEGEYYSKTEQALYIPLHQSTKPFPINTHVVLVPPTTTPSGAAKTEAEAADLARPRQRENSRAVGTAAAPSGKPNSVPLDLVMTVYPNLPVLLQQSQQSNHGVQSVHEPKATQQGGGGGASPSGGTMSVIHEVNVITPPHGYLPASLKPQQQQEASAGVAAAAPPNTRATSSASSSGNDPVTELKPWTRTNDSHAAAAAAAAAIIAAANEHSSSTHLPPVALFRHADTVRPTSTNVTYVSFTPDDVKPNLNPVPVATPSTDRNNNAAAAAAAAAAAQSAAQLTAAQSQFQASVSIVPMSFGDARSAPPTFLNGASEGRSRQPHHLANGAPFEQLKYAPVESAPRKNLIFSGQSTEVVVGSKIATFQPSDSAARAPGADQLPTGSVHSVSIGNGFFGNERPSAVAPANSIGGSANGDDELVTARPDAEQLIPFYSQTLKRVPGQVLDGDRPDHSQYIKPVFPQIQGNFRPMLNHDQSVVEATTNRPSFRPIGAVPTRPQTRPTSFAQVQVKTSADFAPVTGHSVDLVLADGRPTDFATAHVHPTNYEPVRSTEKTVSSSRQIESAPVTNPPSLDLESIDTYPPTYASQVRGLEYALERGRVVSGEHVTPGSLPTDYTTEVWTDETAATRPESSAEKTDLQYEASQSKAQIFEPPQAIVAVAVHQDDLSFAPRLPISTAKTSQMDDDQSVSESKVHGTTSHEVKPPQVLAIGERPEPHAERSAKVVSPHRKSLAYKPGKISPKGAMYTVAQGHSKVRFFGFNALHKALKNADGSYILYAEDPEWKNNPYVPAKVSPLLGSIAGGTLVKRLPKKSVSISAQRNRPSARPVYFAKRQPTPASDEPTLAVQISEPFEYQTHLKSMESDRLPSPSKP